ncbi:MAG: hypothetical protein ACLVK4_14475 [Alistipes shahii]|uniref:hypothetical protein n=1 Tax=Alistipes shahii TaxID=328814 RepID=UPI00399D4F9F
MRKLCLVNDIYSGDGSGKGIDEAVRRSSIPASTAPSVIEAYNAGLLDLAVSDRRATNLFHGGQRRSDAAFDPAQHLSATSPSFAQPRRSRIEQPSGATSRLARTT